MGAVEGDTVGDVVGGVGEAEGEEVGERDGAGVGGVYNTLTLCPPPTTRYTLFIPGVQSASIASSMPFVSPSL